MSVQKLVKLLTLVVCAGSVVGCAESAPVPGTNRALTETPRRTAALHRTTRIAGKLGDLLYVAGTTELLVYSFPDLKLLQTIKNTWAPNAPAGLCSDKKGNIYFVPYGTSSLSTVYVFARGASAPSRTLSDPGAALGCSIDPASGDLAVANVFTYGSVGKGSVAIYKHAQGAPALYFDSYFRFGFAYCAYDNAGNLFADGDDTGSVIDELPKGGNGLVEVSLSQAITPASIQWDGQELAIASGCCGTHGDIQVYQVTVSSGQGLVMGPTQLAVKNDRRELGSPLWVQGNTIVGSDHGLHRHGNLYLWSYPQGGKYVKAVHPAAVSIFGVTVSVGSKPAED